MNNFVLMFDNPFKDVSPLVEVNLLRKWSERSPQIALYAPNADDQD